MNIVQHVLAVDQGQKDIGICPAQYDGSHVEPLFVSVSYARAQAIGTYGYSKG